MTEEEEDALINSLEKRVGNDVVRIDHDDFPNDVADSFTSVLKNFGIEVEEIWPSDDLPCGYYILKAKT